MLYCSLDMVRDICNIFLFGLFFVLSPPLPSPLTAQEIKISKKKQKNTKILFYTCVPKTMIRWCMVPEISCATDRRSEKVWTGCNSLWDEKRKKNCKPNSLIQTLIYRSNICYSKIYQRKDWKNNSSTLHLEMWTRYFRHRYSINSLELQWILRLLNPTNPLWKALMLYWLKLKKDSNQGLCLLRQKQILRSYRHKNLQN